MNIAFTTGGTGGHIYPAISVADEMKKKGHKCIFIGTSHRMEKDLVPSFGYEFYGLDIIPLKSPKSFFKLIRAVSKARKILKNSKIDVLIAFGNYISLPSIIAARFLGINIYLQEQNIKMGMANKFSYKFSKKVFLAFDETLKDIKEKYKNKFVVSGNPLRQDFYNISKEDARKKLNITKDEKILLVIGGSLGAKNINDAVISELEKIENLENFKLYLSSGKNLYDSIKNQVKNLKNIKLMPYIENIAELMASSDIVLSRAGASSISELIQLEKPSILIPYEAKKSVGQLENAELLSLVGASEIYKDTEAKKGFLEAIKLCYDDKKLEFMRMNIKELNKGDARKIIIETIEKDMQNEK